MGLLSFLTRRHAEHRCLGPKHASSSTLALPLPIQGARPVTHDGLASPSLVLHPLPPPLPKRPSRQRPASPVRPYFLGVRDGDGPECGPRHNDPAHCRPPQPSSRRFSLLFKPRESGGGNGCSGSSSRRWSRRAEAPPPPRPRPAAPARAGRYVDLLDAQGEIAPCDFKTRVRAAGTRDYGEDVAERNMAMAATPDWLLRSPAAEPDWLAPAPAPSRGGAAGGGRETGAKPPGRSVFAITAFAEHGERPARRRRRSSSSASSLGADGPVVAFGARAGEGLAPPLERPSTQPGWDSDRRRSAASQARQRTTMLAAVLRAADESGANQPSASPPPVARHRPRSAVVLPPDAPHQRPHTGDGRPRSEAFAADGRRAAPRGARLKPVRSPELKALHPPVALTAIQRHQRGRQNPAWGCESSGEESFGGGYARPSATMLGGRREEASPGRYARQLMSSWDQPPRAGSSMSKRSSTSAHELAVEFAGHVPDRRSSLKQWSFSSLTPTTDMSDHSSSLAARPRSAITIDTSVDLPYARGPSCAKRRPASSSDSHDGPTISFYGQAASGGGRQGQRLAFDESVWDPPATDESDVDSFAERRRQSRVDPDGESLLFNLEGYGSAGNTLPGLYSPAVLSPRLTPDSGARDDFRAPRAFRNNRAPMGARDRLRALGYRYDTEDSASEPERVTRARSRPRPYVSRRRGKANAQEYLALTMPRRARMGGRIEPVLEDYYEEGHASDVE